MLLHIDWSDEDWEATGVAHLVLSGLDSKDGWKVIQPDFQIGDSGSVMIVEPVWVGPGRVCTLSGGRGPGAVAGGPL